MVLNRRSALWLLFIMAFANAMVYWSVKPIWFFIDSELGSVAGSEYFWSRFFMVLISAAVLFSFGGIVRIRQELSWRRLVPLVLTLIFTVFNIYLYTMLGSEKGIILRNIGEILPGLLIYGLILFVLYMYPRLSFLSHNRGKAILGALILFFFLLPFLDPIAVEISSGPLVQRTGDGYITVLWTTNRPTRGWVEYGPDEDHLTTAVSAESGLVRGNRTHHKVRIPAEGDSGIVFRTGSRKVRKQYQNNVIYGGTVYSPFMQYTAGGQKDDVSFYVMSDIHEREDLYKTFLNGEDFDFVVFNGDILSSVDTEEVIVSEFLAPLSESLGQLKPFYFTRGNHETRGGAATELISYLALPDDSYYYAFTYGPLFALVLDSGEDKEDGHREYGGLARFESYRQEQTEWLKSLLDRREIREAPYRIAFSHIPLNSHNALPEESPLRSYEEEWVALLNRLEVDALFSGHTHKSEIIEPDGDKFSFPIFIGGGYKTAFSGYAAMRVQAGPQRLDVNFVDEEGDIFDSYSIVK